jgi:hypothetical protein
LTQQRCFDDTLVNLQTMIFCPCKQGFNRKTPFLKHQKEDVLWGCEPTN